MKALEFEAVLTPDFTLAVPPTVAVHLPRGKSLRVMVFYCESVDTGPQSWKDAAEQLQPEDYGSDTLYDEASGK
jgi:hypothetical protein